MNTLHIDIPSSWDYYPESALAGTHVEAEFSDEGDLEGFHVSDGHWGSPDDLEAGELLDAINTFLRV